MLKFFSLLTGLSICKRLTAYEGYMIPDAEIYVSKNDTTMRAIELHSEMPKSMHLRGTNIWIASIDAINSEVGRKYSLELHLYNPLRGFKQVLLKFRTPTNLFLSQVALLFEVQDWIGIIKSEVEFQFLGYFKLKYNSNTSLNLQNYEMTINYKLLQSKEESINWILKVVESSNKLKEIDYTYESQIISTQFSKYNTQITFYQRVILEHRNHKIFNPNPIPTPSKVKI
jgi:hypothetical protein